MMHRFSLLGVSLIQLKAYDYFAQSQME